MGLLAATIDDTPALSDLYAWRGDSFSLPVTFLVLTGSVADGITDRSQTIRSATAAWSVSDVGRGVVGDNVPFGAQISEVPAPGQIRISEFTTDAQSGTNLSWGIPRDVSGWVFAAQVRTHPDTPRTVADFSFNMSDAVNGCVLGTIDPGPMAAMPSRPSRLYWDLQATIGDTPLTLMYGAFVVGLDRTRP